EAPADAAYALMLATPSFVHAMDDDFNTPEALATPFGLATAINRAADDGQNASLMQDELRTLAGVLGLTLEDTTDAEASLDVVALSKLAKHFSVVCGGTDAASTIEALLAHREEARKT